MTEIEVGGVPGLLWSGGEGPRPVVLLGHGRGADKRMPPMIAAAERFAAHGLTAIALDAPGHGDRRAEDVPPKPDLHQWADEWSACLDELVGAGVPVGWWGFSMGAAGGIALLARDARVQAAAMGLMHDHYYDTILDDAAAITCPLLFSLHRDDERAPFAEGLALYDALGSTDKRLHVHPGRHGDFTAEELTAAEDFLLARLGQSSRRSSFG